MNNLYIVAVVKSVVNALLCECSWVVNSAFSTREAERLFLNEGTRTSKEGHALSMSMESVRHPGKDSTCLTEETKRLS